MTSLSREFEIDADCYEHLNDLDDGEQNLEDEANQMLKSWDRDQLLKEISEDAEKIKRDIENKSIDYYDGETDFDQIASEMEALEGGQIYIKILDPNPSGRQINASHTILFDRIGYLEYELIPWESSVYDGKPTKLSLIEGPILPGMLRALINLREGEKANIMIRPSMAYGHLGCPPFVPEEASLFYHVKIHKIWDESQLNDVLEYERSYKMDIPIQEKILYIEEHKEIANTYLRDNLPREAIIRYKAAIKCLDELPSAFLEKSDSIIKLMITLLQNAAIAFNKLGMHKSATKIAKRALSMNSTSTKAYYQLAKARIGMADYSGALKWIERAAKISPESSSSFDHLRLQIDFQYRGEEKKRLEMMKKMSKACL